MLKGKYNKIIWLRNSTPVPATQEVAALSGRELEAESWDHCVWKKWIEFNVHHANFTAWSPSFPGKKLSFLRIGNCNTSFGSRSGNASRTWNRKLPVGHGMGNFSLHLLCLLPKLPAFHSILLVKKVYNPKSHPRLVYQENTKAWLT